MRVNPNTDMIGGYAGLMIGGRQYTVRFKRPWRPQFDTRIGPYGFRVVEPFAEIRLVLDANDSALELRSHVAGARRRPSRKPTTSRPPAAGAPPTRPATPRAARREGWIEFDGRRIEVTRDRWWGSRDHSWGLYQERAPLAPPARFVRPKERPAVRRALRFWTVFSSPDVSGFFGLHEGERGERIELNDVFGTPFEGALHRAWTARRSSWSPPSTRSPWCRARPASSAPRVKLIDADGGVWTQELEDVGTPWWPHTIGYGAGSWKDGGSMASYPGTDDVVVEWDDFDFSVQPFEHTTYDGRQVKGGAPHAEHLARTTTTTPDGIVSVGAGQVELFLDPPYLPYGLTTR